MIQTLSSNWWAFALRGVVAIALGILAFVQPNATLIALIAVFAAYAIFDGVLAIAAGVSIEGGPRWSFILGGILGIVVGLLTINRPDVTAIALVYLIAVWAIATGIAEAVGAYQLREVIQNEWLLAISGVISIVFGAYLIVAPGDGVLTVLWIIGIYAIIAGVMYVGAGLRLRSIHETLKPIQNALSGGAQSSATNSGAAAGS